MFYENRWRSVEAREAQQKGVGGEVRACFSTQATPNCDKFYARTKTFRGSKSYLYSSVVNNGRNYVNSIFSP